MGEIHENLMWHLFGHVTIEGWGGIPSERVLLGFE